MSLATVAAVVGITGGINSLTGNPIGRALGGGSGQQGGSSSSNTYVPTGLGNADTAWQQILAQLQQSSSGAAGQINPAISAAFSNLMGVPTGGLTTAGQNAGNYYGSLASNQDAMHNNLVNQGNQAGAAGQAIWNTALDPQNALRNQLQQQVTDASRAGTSARGLGMGGVGAGIENSDVSNFLMNWQNQQLQRQIAGSGAQNAAFNQAGNDYTGASNLATAAAGNIGNSALVPYQMSTMAAGAPFNYANMFNQAQGGSNQNMAAIMAQIIPYMNSGQGATGQAFNQGQTNLNNTTSAIGQLGTYLPSVFNQQLPYGNNLPEVPQGGYGDPYASGGYGT